MCYNTLMDLSGLALYKIDEANKTENGIYKTSIDGLFYIDTVVHRDDRGFYREISIIPDLNTVRNEEFEVKQLNHSSSLKNVIRGIHAENWNKLITVTHGECLCVFADVRPDSPTFLKKEYFLLGYAGKNTLSGSVFVSKGIGNSFLTLTESSEYIYAVDQVYRDRDKSGDIAVSLFDNDLDIKWPIEEKEMIYSDRDKNSVTLRELYPNKF